MLNHEQADPTKCYVCGPLAELFDGGKESEYAITYGDGKNFTYCEEHAAQMVEIADHIGDIVDFQKVQK